MTTQNTFGLVGTMLGLCTLGAGAGSPLMPQDAQARAGVAAERGVDPAGGATYPAGFDYWHTIDGMAEIRFGAGDGMISLTEDLWQFGPGADPVVGVIDLQSDMSVWEEGENADTVIGREGDLVLPAPGAIDSTPLELYWFYLESTDPVTITRNGGQDPELWDLEVYSVSALPGNTAQTSTVELVTTDSGTIDAGMPVLLQLMFTKQDDPSQTGGYSVLTDLSLSGTWDETPVPDGISTGPNFFGETLNLALTTPSDTKPSLLFDLEPAVSGVEDSDACAADLNDDGVATFPDVGLYLAAFQASDLSADFNDDGSVTFPDLGAFIDAFSSGCP